jgi:hypothetical protein
MYGDVRQGSVLREEFFNHHPEGDAPEEDVRHRYSPETNSYPQQQDDDAQPSHETNKLTSGQRNKGRGYASFDDIPVKDDDKERRRQRQQSLSEQDVAWNEPFFGDVVAGVAADIDGGARARQPEARSSRRGRELHRPYTTNHIVVLEDEKAEMRTRDEGTYTAMPMSLLHVKSFIPYALL